MRAVFSILALVITLALVALLARNSMKATAIGPASATANGAPASFDPAARERQATEQVRKALAEAAAASQRQRDTAEQN